ncbi:cardiolipin synthase [Cytobacillus dafuensis]|uniref:Cardiolipin synthase n=1 Tax=Cytobacillus dafuensis TaxID=1742359 RepID=A0A5B8Z9V9_CYTDA|nr:cardiolipin synthase [Cytobacillus dafuensis]QED49760.1 cardiolipin synthase [Cytobacillus dafuensis]
MKVLFILIIILLFILLWLSLDFYLGRKNQIKHLKRQDPPFRHSHIDLYTDGPELFADFFSELKKAKHHIHILFYIVKDDQFSTEFLNILKDKAKEGVEVRLLLDRIGSHLIKENTIQSLESHGVKFAFSHPLRFPFIFYSLHARNHRKITVIDGKIGYIGGFNIGKEYINLDPKLSPWRDYHLKMIGEGAADLQKEFLTDWYNEKKIHLLENPIYFPSLPKGSCQHQIIPSRGIYLEETFSSMIRNARTSIIIGSPYFILSKRLLNDLLAARGRGVTLTILVPKTADHPFVKEASYPFLRKLISQGAIVYQFLNGFYHAKTCIIDDKICDIGTANFDHRSLFLNYEINCYIYDHAFIQKVLKVIETDIHHSKKLTLKELNQFDPWRSCKEIVARSIRMFL